MTSPNTSHSHDTSQGRRHRRSASSAHHGPRPEWQESKSKEPARRGRRRFGLLLTAVALGVFVWFLPVLVTHTGLLNWIVARATGDLKGSATVKSASLGWFSPVRVSGIQVRDTQGNVVVDVPELAGDTPLAKLALNWKRPGTFTLTQPTVRVVLRGDGSNVEDLIANYLTGPSGEPVAVGLNVIDATIQVQDASGGTPWTIEKFNLALATSNQKDGPMTLAASGLMPEGATAGKFDVKLATGPESRAQLQAEGLPMGRL
ncbi:MAG TPA: hypothetical protein VJL29_11035, partial [Thermoguttaceae bacterium]|nr:hypothetical protein [Thermoguttaceae bacterium]